MRRLIAVTAAATMLLGTIGAGSVFAAPNAHAGNHPSALSRTQVLRVHVNPNVQQGGRLVLLATVSHCDRANLATLSATAATDLTTGSVTLRRMGVVNNTASHSHSCVFRASFVVSSTALLGSHDVTFSLVRTGTLAGTTLKTVKTMVTAKAS